MDLTSIQRFHHFKIINIVLIEIVVGFLVITQEYYLKLQTNLKNPLTLYIMGFGLNTNPEKTWHQWQWDTQIFIFEGAYEHMMVDKQWHKTRREKSRNERKTNYFRNKKSKHEPDRDKVVSFRKMVKPGQTRCCWHLSDRRKSWFTRNGKLSYTQSSITESRKKYFLVEP